VFDGRAAGWVYASLPDWSADGRFIYFNGIDSTGPAALYAIPTAGGTPREVVRFEDPTKDLSHLPGHLRTLGEGKAYFSLKEIESDIYVMDLEMK